MEPKLKENYDVVYKAAAKWLRMEMVFAPYSKEIEPIWYVLLNYNQPDVPAWLVKQQRTDASIVLRAKKAFSHAAMSIGYKNIVLLWEQYVQAGNMTKRERKILRANPWLIIAVLAELEYLDQQTKHR